jgi:hypothetical protein
MNENPLKDNEGSISVDGDITPITHQKIEKVYSNRWHQMIVSDLHEQRGILLRRYNAALAIGMHGPAKLIMEGINQIDALLAAKQSQNTTELL